MSCALRSILILVIAVCLLGVSSSCGGGLSPLATIVKYTYKIIKLFKDPQPVAAANVETPDAPEGTNAGRADVATLQVANLTGGNLSFWIDGESIEPQTFVIAPGATLIGEYAPGVYDARSGATGEPKPITLSAGTAYRLEVVEREVEFRQTVDQNTGQVISEAPTGKAEDKPEFLPPESEWGTISVANETDIPQPQYVNGELMGILQPNPGGASPPPPGSVGEYRIPAGDHVISNTLDVADPDAAFLWFNVRKAETRTIRLRQR